MGNYLILLVLQHVFPAAEGCCLIQLPESSTNILMVLWPPLIFCLVAVLCMLFPRSVYLGLIVT